MSCNCNCDGNSCGVPKQPNYNNLNKGFITPKKGCCDCGECNKVCKNNLRTIIYNNVDSNNIIEDENGDLVANINIYLNNLTYITTNKYCDKVYISFGDIGLCEKINYEYKLMIIDGANTGAEFIFEEPIIWANNEAPDINDGSLYEISISQNDFGTWFGVWLKYG